MRVVFISFLVSTGALAQWLNHKTPGIPRLPDGKANLSAPAPRLANGTPDLSGVWAAECAIYDGNPCFVGSLFFNLARDLKPEEVQTTPWAAAVSAQREGRQHVDDPYGFCMPLFFLRTTDPSALCALMRSPYRFRRRSVPDCADDGRDRVPLRDSCRHDLPAGVHGRKIVAGGGRHDVAGLFGRPMGQ